MRTLLFDIDGTLLTANHSGKLAFSEALRLEFSIARPNMEIRFHGRTDAGLMMDLLRMNDLSANDRNRARLRRAYAEAFPQQLNESGGTVFPGVVELFEHLGASNECRLAVMTGNLPETASRKLQHFELQHHVEWIIGGDLDENRNAMARRAVRHVQRIHGADAADDLVVIGDTLADIQCAREIDAEVVIVCTGGEDRQVLMDANPDSIWDDFSDWNRVAESLLRGEQEAPS
ncbi:MAG: HAD family hydrolase [Planctomycetota bacterium]